MISIIIPIFNAESYLEECLSSILQQSYVYYEVICVNDGSSDKSPEICQKYVDIDDRFKLFNKENSGVSAARNVGLAHAQGDYICFVDADDKIHRNYLKQLLSLHQDGTIPICSYATNVKELGVGGKKIKYDAKKYIRHIFDEDIPHPNLWAMLFDAKIIKDNNIQFVVGCIKNEDTEFFVKYMANINSVIVTNYKGYYYRVNPNSCMNTGIDVRSLTSIEAQARIANYLYDKQIVSDRDRILGASVQVYVFATAKDGNNKLYDIIHDKYDVKYFMACMLRHPRLSRKGVSLCYLLLGRPIFYKVLSFVSRV